LGLFQVVIPVSIHAPAGGATFFLFLALVLLSFNPRARGGRDADLDNAACQMAVSIHAPAGGATQL